MKISRSLPRFGALEKQRRPKDLKKKLKPEWAGFFNLLTINS
jgi:hypothetical protein